MLLNANVEAVTAAAAHRALYVYSGAVDPDIRKLANGAEWGVSMQVGSLHLTGEAASRCPGR
jgi:hypothetical protein